MLTVLAASLALAASGCGGSHTETTSAKRTLSDLNTISQLRAAFNTASDEPRLIVLVSPT